MSTQPAIRASARPLVALSAAARRRMSIAGLSLSGLLLFIISFLVLASGFESMRPAIFGLSFHPFLVPVAMAVLFVAPRIDTFPLRVLGPLVAFVAIYCFSVFNGLSVSLGEILKMGTGMVTIVTCALLVRKRGDFVAGVLGLSVAVALLGVRGLQDGPTSELGSLDGANKNSYSLFALPAMLLAGHILLHMQTVPRWVKATLIGSTLPALAVIFMGGNRSGYLGAVLVGLMLFWDRRGKGLLLVGVMAAAVVFWIANFGSTVVLNERLRQTAEGTESDNLRRDIFFACVRIGLENPIIGVSPQQLPFEIGRKVSARYGFSYLQSHNVFGHVLAGSGVICFGTLLALSWSLWSITPHDLLRSLPKGDPVFVARKLVRMYVVLWGVRGFFTNDILYNPSFNIALGLVIGLYMITEAAARKR